MDVTMDLWQLLGASASVLTFFSASLIAAGKMLVKQFEKRLDARFVIQEQTQRSSQTHMDSRFTSLELAISKGNEESLRLERALMELKVELPNKYVQREDYIRNQSVIESKIDGLAVRIENAILRSDRHG